MKLTAQHYITGALMLLIGWQIYFHQAAKPATKNTEHAQRNQLSEQQAANNELTARLRRQTHLLKLTTNRIKRNSAAAELPYSRQRILAAHQAEWTEIIDQNWDEYQRLIQVAQQNKNGMCDCSICGADTYLDICIFCQQPSNGRCADCASSGIVIWRRSMPELSGQRTMLYVYASITSNDVSILP